MVVYPRSRVLYLHSAIPYEALSAVTLPSVAGLFSYKHYVCTELLYVKHLYAFFGNALYAILHDCLGKLYKAAHRDADDVCKRI